MKNLVDFLQNINEAQQDYELVDLGLPSGTLWMDRNIGAKSPTDYGLYFAWGDTKGYTGNYGRNKNKFGGWDKYKWAETEDPVLTKYCIDDEFGDVDGITKLENADDAAYKYTNGKCKMPTEAQLKELCNSDNTDFEFTDRDGIHGCLITSKKNGKSIFIPACGFYDYDGYANVSRNIDLWSSSLSNLDTTNACCLDLNKKYDHCIVDSDRFVGMCVRGVSK